MGKPMNGRYHGKRYSSFLVVAGLLTVGLFWGQAALYVVFAQTLGLAYAVYLGGQSATDWQKAKNGNSA